LTATPTYRICDKPMPIIELRPFTIGIVDDRIVITECENPLTILTELIIKAILLQVNCKGGDYGKH
jgi:hypothetical protein